MTADKETPCVRKRQEPPEDPEVWGVKEAAEFAKLSTKTMYRIFSRRNFPLIKSSPGKKVYKHKFIEYFQ